MNPVVEQIIGKLIIDPIFRQAFGSRSPDCAGSLPADTNGAHRPDAV